ncbi:MAG: RelA/SpoT family protein [bacterium]|nr:RelA/SpoT family protein [bacterium]
MKKEELFECIEQQRPDADLELLKRAYDFAEAAHEGQLRKSGAPYFDHPKATAYKLANLRMDDVTIAAGLLHDVPEDTSRTHKEITREFGNEIAFLVEGVTKLGQVKYRGMQRYVENLRRMFVAMAKDIRVVVIKFADRTHNLETLSALPPNKQKRIALESLEIYAPIADRLGMGDIKGQIQDLSFPYVYPDEYKWLIDKISNTRREKEKYLRTYRKEIEQILKDHHVAFISVHGRTKHLYSLYKKLLRNNRDLSKIYDLVALRIIVEDVSACYETLGILHKFCTPLKGRIKDYIAQPKPNGYQSLHTTVFSNSGEIIEVQIRTNDMHEEAEYGIAAHWHYKENEKALSKEKYAWIQQLAKLQKEIKDEDQYMESLKIDVFQTRIFVFTPRGDVIDLPEDATPIDFAYHIHTDIGNKCSGAIINDQIAPLDTTLKSGDVLEIIVDKNRQGPNADWMESVKTHSAKRHIQNNINKNNNKRRQKLLKKK